MNNKKYFKKERRRAFILFLLFVITIFADLIPNSFAANATSSYVNTAMSIFGNNPLWEQAKFFYSDSLTGFNAEIDRICAFSGKPNKSISGKWLNPLVYHAYGQIAYGNPTANNENEFLARNGSPTFRNGVQGEYKYIGYDYNDNLITNDHYFPKQQVGIFTTYEEVNWSNINGAKDTWPKLKIPTSVSNCSYIVIS